MSEVKAGIVVTCGSCGSRLRVRPTAEGRTGRCPKCGVRIQIAIPPQVQPAPHAQPAPQAQPMPHAQPMPQAQPIPQAARAAVSIGTPPQGTFLFFPAAASTPEVRPVPANVRVAPRSGVSLRVAIIAFAALMVGAAAIVAVKRFGGSELWVVKQSVVAWMIGVLSAAAIMHTAPQRTSPIRLTAALTAAASIIAAWLYAWPAPFGPIDMLLLALAIAGSGTAFIVAETTPQPRSDAPSPTIRFSH